MSTTFRGMFVLISQVKSFSPVNLYDIYWHCINLMSELVMYFISFIRLDY